MPLKIGILGGTRFIGYHVVEALLQSGASVAVFHRGRTKEPRRFSRPVQRFLGDRNQIQSLEPFFRQSYDAVIDLSGYRPEQVVPLLSRWRSKIGHYLFCSTSSVYRVPPPFDTDENFARVVERGTYGGDKAAVEDVLLDLFSRTGWPVTIFRPQGVIGIFDAKQPLYGWKQILAGKTLRIRRAALDKRLKFVGVGDLAQCFLRAAGNRCAFGQIFNVSGDDIVTPRDFISLLEAVASKGVAREEILDDDAGKRHSDIGLPWLSYDLASNNERIKKELEISFKPLRETLQEIWSWSRSVPPFWLRWVRRR